MSKWSKYRTLTGRTRLPNGGEIYRFDLNLPPDPNSLDALDRWCKVRVQYIKAATLSMMSVSEKCSKLRTKKPSFWERLKKFFGIKASRRCPVKINLLR